MENNEQIMSIAIMHKQNLTLSKLHALIYVINKGAEIKQTSKIVVED